MVAALKFTGGRMVVLLLPVAMLPGLKSKENGNTSIATVNWHQGKPMITINWLTKNTSMKKVCSKPILPPGTMKPVFRAELKPGENICRINFTFQYNTNLPATARQ